MDFIALPLATTGVQVTAGPTSATVAIPNAADGNRARYVRLAIAAASGFAYVRPGLSGTSCTVNDAVLAAGDSIVVPVKPFTHIAYLEGTAGVKINVTPVEF